MESASSAGNARQVAAARAAFATWITGEGPSSLSSQELYAGASDVRALLEHPGWGFVRRLVEQREDAFQAQLVHGGVLSKPQYAALTGVMRGMESVLFLPDAIVEVATERERREQAAAELAEAARNGEWNA